MKTLTEILASVRRELALRRQVYPSRVNARRMSQAKADHEIECFVELEAALVKLKHLEDLSDEIAPGRKDVPDLGTQIRGVAASAVLSALPFHPPKQRDLL